MKALIFSVLITLLAALYAGRELRVVKTSEKAEISTAVKSASLQNFKPEEKPEEKSAVISGAEQFKSQLTQILDEMPTLGNSIPEADEDGDIHGFQPDEILEAEKLAALRSLTLKNENLDPVAQSVYAECAERADLAKPVRAVCFMRAMEISIKLKNTQLIVSMNVPGDVRDLALKLVN